MIETIKQNMKSSRNIGILSVIIFAAVAIAMLFSTYYMNISVTEEENAQTRRSEYQKQGENLADASDYLTEEVQYFAVTGQIQHFYNYWYEIKETKQREEAIHNFESSNPPEREKKLLEEAKEYSDLLVETETYSMKMMLEALDIQAADYPQDKELQAYIEDVTAYQWPPETDDMTSQQMQEHAVEILYDDSYENYKTQIMTPIENFQELMNARLDEEVDMRKDRTRLATIVQVILAVASLAAIGFLMCLINNLYIRPLKRYTREVKQTGVESQEIIYAQDGAIPILTAKIVPYGAGELVSFAESFNGMIDCFYQELCQRKNAEESMRKARNEAELANEAKGIFLAQMSHELRTPLNAVNGYTYLLEKSELSKKQKQYVQNIRYSSDGLLELINQILDFSKIESGHLELESIDFVLANVLNEVQGVLSSQVEEKGLYLKIQMDDRIPSVLIGDPLRMRQLLLNLIGSAVKFTDQGGVDVKVQLEEMTADMCCVRMDVIDTGIGVKEEAVEKIFQPFTQSDGSVTRKYGGTGLGLPICSQIVMLAGKGKHKLQVMSEPGKGSDFYFRMDFPISNQQYIDPKDEWEVVPDFEEQKVLLVDDSMINIRVGIELLRIYNLQVLTASSGSEAIRIMKKESEIVMIFMDIRMPEMDGYETAKRIHGISGCGKIPVIALTADATEEVRNKSKEAGMKKCMLKPIRQEELFSVLSEYFHGNIQDDLKVQPKRICEDGINQQRSQSGMMQYAENKNTSERILFDEDRCMKQLAGNRRALLFMLESFLEIHRDDSQKIGKFVQDQKYIEAENLMHTLKGVTGNLGCRPLSESCSNLQEELHGQAIKGYKAFQVIWQQTWSVLVQASEQIRAEIRTSGNGESRTAAELLTYLEELCRNHDTEAIEYMEQYQTQIQAEFGDACAGRLKRYCRNYDFEKMVTELKEMSRCIG